MSETPSHVRPRLLSPDVTRLSIIVPSRHPATEDVEAWERVAAWPAVHEVILAIPDDIGPPPASASIRVVGAPLGRGSQMNAGSNSATGDAYFFVHSDCRVSEEAVTVVRAAIARRPRDAFALRLRFDHRRGSIRWLERAARWRDALHPYPLGDQGLVIARETFDRMGRFSDLPLMEDVRMLHTLRHRGVRLRVLPSPIVTSALRFRSRGVWTTLARNAGLLILHSFGASPARLARMYYGADFLTRWEKRREAPITLTTEP